MRQAPATMVLAPRTYATAAKPGESFNKSQIRISNSSRTAAAEVSSILSDRIAGSGSSAEIQETGRVVTIGGENIW